MFLTPPPLCRQPAFIQQLIDNENGQLLEGIGEIGGIEGINEQLPEGINEQLEILNLNETIYRGINYSRKASSYSNLEELSRFNNKIPLIKKFNSF